MAWDFARAVQLARSFAGPQHPSGTELAFVFSEAGAEGDLALLAAYPAERENLPPTAALPAARAARLWGDRGSGWEPLADIAPALQAVGLGAAGVLTGGIGAGVVVATYPALPLAFGYVLAPTATLDALNASRTTGLAVMRAFLHAEDGATGFDPDLPFRNADPDEIGFVSAWLNAHGVTNEAFAGWWGLTPAQASAWMQAHPRWQFCDQIATVWGKTE